MGSYEFKVGDRVVIPYGGFSTHGFNGPFTVEKQYKNGNLLVDGKQYRPDGWSTKRDLWSRSYLVLVGSDEHKRLVAASMRASLARFLNEAAKNLRDEITKEEADDARAAVLRLVKQEEAGRG